jgi:hypothetical protein
LAPGMDPKNVKQFLKQKNHRIANTFTILVREKISADLESLEF